MCTGTGRRHSEPPRCSARKEPERVPSPSCRGVHRDRRTPAPLPPRHSGRLESESRVALQGLPKRVDEHRRIACPRRDRLSSMQPPPYRERSFIAQAWTFTIRPSSHGRIGVRRQSHTPGPQPGAAQGRKSRQMQMAMPPGSRVGNYSQEPSSGRHRVPSMQTDLVSRIHYRRYTPVGAVRRRSTRLNH